MRGIWIKYLYWSVSHDKTPYYFRCHLRHFYCLDKYLWKAISEDWAQCWLYVLLWTPGGTEYHVAETAQLLVEAERERYGKGQGPLASFKEMPSAFVFPTRPQFPQAFSNVSSSFESSKGLNFWFGHCPHGLIISEMPLQTEPGICGTCLRGFSPSNQSLVNETSMCMLALPIFLKCCSFLLPIALSGDKTSHWPETRHETGPAGHAPRDLLGLCSPGITSTCCHLQGLSFHMCGLRINLRSVCLQSSHSADGTISPAKIKVKQ